MPPRKEPKEAVVYPASKRKPPPFKPQRPSKVPRTESLPSAPPSQPIRRIASAPTSSVRKAAPTVIADSDSEDENQEQKQLGQSSRNSLPPDDDVLSSASSDLPEDPLKVTQKPASRPPPGRRKATTDSNASDCAERNPSERDGDVFTDVLPLDDSTPIIPQPLLVRLLHEHFVDKSTKIDKHAIQVLQKYIEVFVREAIARTALYKKEAAAGTSDEAHIMADTDVSWLELEDLDRVAAGMMLDF